MTNWIGFAIAFGLLAIVPVWVIQIIELTFVTKIIATLVLGVITYLAVEFGGAKRGFIAK